MEEKKVYKCEKCDKIYKNYKSLWKHNYVYHKNIKVENTKTKKKKFICDKCNKNFNSLGDISNHSKNDCRPSLKSNNVYTFKTDTFGKNKYKDFKGGDIYIVQTEFNLKGFYKIGISTDLYQRLGQYRCGAVLEPKLHFYYPCKNIKETDKLLKATLKKFNVKREIYTAENIDELRNAIKEVQKKSGSIELEVIPENKECDIIPCNYCDLYFTNKQDFFIHIDKNHKEQYDLDNKKDKNKCSNCNKLLSNYYSCWRHEKLCKNNKNDDLKNELFEVKKENIEIRNEITELKNIINKLQNSKQIHITD